MCVCMNFRHFAWNNQMQKKYKKIIKKYKNDEKMQDETFRRAKNPHFPHNIRRFNQIDLWKKNSNNLHRFYCG